MAKDKKKRGLFAVLFDRTPRKKDKKKKLKPNKKKNNSIKTAFSKNKNKGKKSDTKFSKKKNSLHPEAKMQSKINNTDKDDIPTIKADAIKLPRNEMKNIKVGKSQDNLIGVGIKKPRNYAVIDEVDGRIAVSKIQTHNQNNPKHVQKMNNGLRKPIKRFGPQSVLDKTLYIKKINGDPIKSIELDYEKSNFEFNKSESKSLRKFIFSSKTNRDAYYEFINGKKKLDKDIVDI